MENVTDRTSNPFGMRPPCRERCDAAVPAVFGYGDANADFHVVGDHPGVHGGGSTGVPFTDSVAGERIQSLLHETGFTPEPYSDEPELTNAFASYVHMCCTPGSREPTPGEYAELERFFDAELRAINAHILLSVGERATGRVLTEYTTLAHRVDLDMERLHARQLRGRGFLVVPVREPGEWTGRDQERLSTTLHAILASDYRQTKGVATHIG